MHGTNTKPELTGGIRMGRMATLCGLLVAFTSYSIIVSWQHGYWGFIDVARAGGWGTQVFLDLCIACALVSAYMLRQGRKSGLNAWPYVLSLPFLGSIGALACLIHVEWRRRP